VDASLWLGPDVMMDLDEGKCLDDDNDDDDDDDDDDDSC
jgi:hypothetical protein